MTEVISLLTGVLLGLLLFPLFLHQRASRSDGVKDGVNFDKSNRSNTYSVLAHYGTHPEDFFLMEYPDKKRPFKYLNKDLITDILKSRPNG